MFLHVVCVLLELMAVHIPHTVLTATLEARGMQTAAGAAVGLMALTCAQCKTSWTS